MADHSIIILKKILSKRRGQFYIIVKSERFKARNETDPLSRLFISLKRLAVAIDWHVQRENGFFADTIARTLDVTIQNGNDFRLNVRRTPAEGLVRDRN